MVAIDKMGLAINALEKKLGSSIVEKMVESYFGWFGHVWRRPVQALVRRVDQMESSPTSRGRGRHRKTIDEILKEI